MLTISSTVFFICLSSFESCSSSDELVTPLGFMGTVADLFISLRRMRIVCEMLEEPRRTDSSSHHTIEPTHDEVVFELKYKI